MLFQTGLKRNKCDTAKIRTRSASIVAKRVAAGLLRFRAVQGKRAVIIQHRRANCRMECVRSFDEIAWSLSGSEPLLRLRSDRRRCGDAKH